MKVSDLISRLERVLKVHGDKPISIGIVGKESDAGPEGPILIDEFMIVACGNVQDRIEQIILAPDEDVNDGFFGEPQRRLKAVR